MCNTAEEERFVGFKNPTYRAYTLNSTANLLIQ